MGSVCCPLGRKKIADKSYLHNETKATTICITNNIKKNNNKLDEINEEQMPLVKLIELSNPTYIPQKWNCQSCTYSNHHSYDLCEICGTSKPNDDTIYANMNQVKCISINIECAYPSCNQQIPMNEYEAHKLLHKQDANNLNNVLQEQLEEMRKELERVKLKYEEKTQEDERKLNKLKVEYPTWWDLNQLNGLKYGDAKLVELDLNKDEIAKQVAYSFYKTAKNERIMKIEYIINQMLYDKWWNEMKSLSKSIGDNKLNERNLFHGTKRDDIMSFIIKEGFRKEFNKKSNYGKGTYFAKNADYSLRYSSINRYGIRKMLQCLVICGESTKGNKKYELISWPKKPSGLIYDSLVDHLDKPSIFVIHNEYRVYPLFIIHFKQKKKC